MISNPLSMILQKVRNDFDTLVTTVTDEQNMACTADQMERHLLQQLICLGGQLLQLYFCMKTEQASREAITREDGTRLRYHRDTDRQYHSIFGELLIQRPYFYKKGEGGYVPMDAELGLGDDSYSDCLRQIHTELGVEIPFGHVLNIVDRLLGIHLSSQSVHQFMETDAIDVKAFYEQKMAPPVETEGTTMVLLNDAKGIRMIDTSKKEQEVRLKRGQAASRKQNANVNGIYTIFPTYRTIDDIMNSLWKIEGSQSDLNRSSPCYKQIFGTLESKEKAIEWLKQQMMLRMGPHIQHKVMLSDGDKALQKELKKQFPEFTLILDFIHAHEKLWLLANSLWSQDAPERNPWVKEQTRILLDNGALLLSHKFREMAENTTYYTKSQQAILKKVATYFENNAPYMNYHYYLNNGWPIGSGVIEGACRHYVKDRFELSGMRWSVDGAENLLHLRAVAENGDWDDYHRFLQQQRQQRLYQCDWPADIDLPTLTRPIRQRCPIGPKITNEDYMRLPMAV